MNTTPRDESGAPTTDAIPGQVGVYQRPAGSRVGMPAFQVLAQSRQAGEQSTHSGLLHPC